MKAPVVLADTALAARDEQGKQVFPTGGTRVLRSGGTLCGGGRRLGVTQSEVVTATTPLCTCESAHGQGRSACVR